MKYAQCYLTCFVGLASLTAARFAVAQTYTVTQLHRISSTTSTSFTALSPSGQVGGTAVGQIVNPAPGQSQAFIWQGGDFTYLPALHNYPGAALIAVGSAGEAVGQSATDGYTSILWRNNVPTALPHFFAQAIASNGDVAGVPSTYIQSAAYWHQGTEVFLEPPLGSTGMTYVTGINSSDQVVGYLVDQNGVQQAIRWQANSQFTLFAANATPNAINDSGTIVGSIPKMTNATYANGFAAVAWSGSTLTQTILPTLGPADSYSVAYSINNSGAIVGFAGEDPNTGNGQVAALWFDGQVIDLNQKISSSLPAGVTARFATDINDAGQILVTAYDAAANAYQYLLTPSNLSLDTAIPSFSPLPRTYASTQTVSLSDATPNASIYYTVDGSVPTESSMRYSAPVTVASTVTIKAIAVGGSPYAASTVSSATYTLAVPATPPPVADLESTNSVYAVGSLFDKPNGGGIDGDGNALDSALLGPTFAWGGAQFTFGTPNTKDASADTTIALTAGYYANLKVLALGVHGSTANQKFTVNYTDGSSQSLLQGVSDWASPQKYPGESVVLEMAHRITPSGTLSYGPYYLYGYSLPINSNKQVSSLVTPVDPRVIVLGVAETNERGHEFLVDLSDTFNVSGIYSSGPISGGGLDLYGNAYAESLLGTSLSWTGTTFQLGSAGVPDAVTRSTVALPAGNFATLKILATGVRGNQVNQPFKINYADGSSQLVTQSLSDWHTPQHYTGESIASTMVYRLDSSGDPHMGPYNLYAYAFTLNASKVIESITLPATNGVIALAMTLVP